jgi:hypothetical protein
MLNVEIDITEVTDKKKTLTAKITIKSVNDIRAMLKLKSVATFVLLEGEYFLFNAWIANFQTCHGGNKLLLDENEDVVQDLNT